MAGNLFKQYLVKSEHMDYSVFYTELGKLAYSIARADGVVQSEEVDKICDLIGEEISVNDADESFQRETVLETAAEFNKLRNENASARDAFNGFTNYLDSNISEFDHRIKNLFIRVAMRIAAANEGVNETESALIDKLRKKLSAVN